VKSYFASSNISRYCAVLMLMSSLMLATASAQNFSVIHYFTGTEGWSPGGTLLLDQGGNLWGSATYGGSHNVGTVYKMSPYGSSWTLKPLYSFPGTYSSQCNMGGCPLGGLVRDAAGVVYGVTYGGGTLGGGSIYQLRPSSQPPASLLPQWLETTLYSFASIGNGRHVPTNDGLVTDAQGNLYGATEYGGTGSGCDPTGCGTVYELQKSAAGYNYITLYSFGSQSRDGAYPLAGVTLDSAGNLYGTNTNGGTHGNGTVYKLTSGQSGWTETVIYSFRNQEDGGFATEGITVGPSGELYGSTAAGGLGGGGVVFELTPFGGGWNYTAVYSLHGAQGPQGGNLTLTDDGSLYGTALADGVNNMGSVFRLSPSGSGWIYTSLHDFTCGLDGCYPVGGVTIDSSGVLYGTATYGGTSGDCSSFNQTCGVVWGIAP
jgi:uncharacterized repeat protein (TIGR03803 family)